MAATLRARSSAIFTRYAAPSCESDGALLSHSAIASLTEDSEGAGKLTTLVVVTFLLARDMIKTPCGLRPAKDPKTEGWFMKNHRTERRNVDGPVTPFSGRGMKTARRDAGPVVRECVSWLERQRGSGLRARLQVRK